MRATRRWALTTLLAAGLAGCGAAGLSPAPGPVATIPPDWVAVSTTAGDIRLTLPPWLAPFDTMQAIYANERPAPGASIDVQLMASGAGFMQPVPNEEVAAWIDRLLTDTGSGVPVVTRVSLPAGQAVRYERIDRGGTPSEWHILAFGIKTSSGYAYLQIDASPEGWRRRASEFDGIALLLRAF